MISRWKSLLCASLPPLCFAAYPLACGLFALCGVRLTLRHPSAYAALVLLLSVAPCVLRSLSRWPQTREMEAAYALTLPLSLLHALFISFHDSGTVGLGLVAAAIGPLLMFSRHTSQGMMKTLSGILSSLLLFPVLTLCTAAALFEDFGERTVLRTLDSPDGLRTAWVELVDEGALGGSTLVSVGKAPEDELLFRLDGRRRLYVGRYSQAERLEVRWLDGESLLIDGTAYRVP